MEDDANNSYIFYEERVKVFNLQSKKNDLEVIVDSVPMGIIIVDETLMVRYTNKFFIKMFNMSYSEIVNKDPGDCICCINSFISSKRCGYSEKCNEKIEF